MSDEFILWPKRRGWPKLEGYENLTTAQNFLIRNNLKPEAVVRLSIGEAKQQVLDYILKRLVELNYHNGNTVTINHELKRFNFVDSLIRFYYKIIKERYKEKTTTEFITKDTRVQVRWYDGKKYRSGKGIIQTCAGTRSRPLYLIKVGNEIVRVGRSSFKILNKNT